MFSSPFPRLLTLGALLTMGLSQSASAQDTYLALGDSVGFGFTTLATTLPSYGDQGYVKAYADSLGTQTGARPNVINLSVPDQTTSDFFTGGPTVQVLGSSHYAEELNLNYFNPAQGILPSTTSQNTLLQKTLTTQGSAITHITVQLGANDLSEQTIDVPGFTNLSPQAQQAAILAALNTVQTNYTMILAELRAAEPTADIALVGYYDPLPSTNPLYAFADPAIQALNSVIAGEANAFDARYIDIYTPFQGHVTDYTFYSQLGYPDGQHPNALGYSVIAAQLTVPEPSSVAFLLAGGSTGMGLLLRRRRARK